MRCETTKYWTERGRPPVDVAIAKLSERQHGVVALAQLRGLGLEASTVRSRAAAGRLHRLHRGVFAVGRRTVDVHGRWMAAVLACGTGALLSRGSSLELWGALAPSGRPISVTTPGSPRTRAGIEVHRSSTLTAADRAIVDGIPCTSVARTLLDFAATARPRELARAVEELERLRLFDGRDMDRVLKSGNGSRGIGRLQAVLAEWTEPAFTRSEAERRLLELIRAASLPSPLVNTWVAGYEVDLYWPEHGLAVEFDGYAYHHTRQAVERDAARDADLDDAGIGVLRVTWNQLEHQPRRLIERLSRKLRG